MGGVLPGAAAAFSPVDVVAIAGQPEGLPIRSVVVLPRNIYDPLPPGRLRPVYRLANGLHQRSRRSTIENQLLFRIGEPWTESRGRETARALRATGIVEPVRIEAIQAGDSVDVVVETRDEWTTQPEFALESVGSDVFTAFSMAERNVLGWGKEVRVAYRDFPEGVSRAFSYVDPQVAGSRVRAGFEAGNGTEGAHETVTAEVPFYSEDAPFGYGARWSLATSVVRLFQEGVESATFDRRTEEAEVRWARGRRLGEDVLRLGGLFQMQDRRFGPSLASPGAPPEFEGGEENVKIRRLVLEGFWWRPDFSEWQGVDRLGGVEDVDLGFSVRLRAGVSSRWMGSTTDEGYGGARVEGALRVGTRSFGAAMADVSSRIRTAPEEMVARTRLRWVSQHWPSHTLVFSGYGAAARRPSRDFQEILGGLSGLRAYPVRALAGEQAWRFNAEHRWLVAHEMFALLSLGVVGFYDVGRTWGAGSAPGGWHQDAGFGLRIALPRSGLTRVMRIDVAWPIREGIEGRPVISLGSGQAF